MSIAPRTGLRADTEQRARAMRYARLTGQEWAESITIARSVSRRTPHFVANQLSAIPETNAECRSNRCDVIICRGVRRDHACGQDVVRNKMHYGLCKPRPLVLLLGCYGDDFPDVVFSLPYPCNGAQAPASEMPSVQ